jgi:hypothetical protein
VLFDLVAGKPVPIEFPPCTPTKADEPGQCDIWQAATAPNAPLVAVMQGAGALHLVDMETGKIVRQFEGWKGRAPIAFSGDGSRLVSLRESSSDSVFAQVKVWDVATGKALSISGVTPADYSLLRVNTDGSRLLLSAAESYDIDDRRFAMWETLSPIGNETPKQAVARICKLHGDGGLKLSDEERGLLPSRFARSNDICAW